MSTFCSNTSLVTMYAFVLVVFSIAAKHAYGEETGAPSKTCKHMAPFHVKPGLVPIPSPGQEVQSPYTFEAMWDKKLRMIRVSVSGQTIAGFLIQGRLSKNGPAVGTFVNIDENFAKYQDCSKDKFGPQSSVTHSRPSKKQNLVFLWQPPENMSTTEKVTFYGTLVLSRDVFWVKQETNSLGLAALENEKPVTNGPTSNSTSNSTSNPTSNPTSNSTSGSKTATVGVSLLSILLAITIKVLIS